MGGFLNKRFGEGFDCSCLLVGFGKGFYGDRSIDSEACINNRFGDSKAYSNDPNYGRSGDCGRSGGPKGLVAVISFLYSCTNSLASPKCLILYY